MDYELCKNHDYEITAIQNEDGSDFKGDLYKCKLCNYEHLCTQRKPMGPTCTHINNNFYI